VQLVKDPGSILKVPLFDYDLLLAAAGWHRMMPSGGSFFFEEKLAISESYGTITFACGWDEGLVLGEGNQPDPCFDP